MKKRIYIITITHKNIAAMMCRIIKQEAFFLNIMFKVYIKILVL